MEDMFDDAVAVAEDSQADRIKELEKLIFAARKPYYNGNPIMEDSEYDALEDELRELAPDSKVFDEVGADDGSDDSVKFSKEKHQVPMGSQSKCANEDEFRDWDRLHNLENESVLATYKLDGASLNVVYEDGKLAKAVTRGNGVVGRNITSNAKNFIGIPATISMKERLDIRGECILSTENWKAIDPKALNPRNLGTGIMSREDGKDSDKLRFIAFDVVCEKKEFKTEHEKMKFLRHIGIEVTWYKICKNVDEAIEFYQKIAKGRTNCAVRLHDYHVWIDGIVMKLNSVATQEKLGISSGRPKWSTALKFPPPGAITYIKDVELGVGHTGAITPVAWIEPVQIGGTTVKRATLNNWDFINMMDVAIGDKVKIVKGGDIIPKLVSVIDRPKNRTVIPAPTECPECGGPVGRDTNVTGDLGAVIRCTNTDCDAQAVGKFKRMVKRLEILEIGESIIVGMYEAGIIKTIADMFRIENHRTEISKLEVGNGVWGESRTDKMIDEVNKKKKMTLDVFLGMLGIKGLGQRRAKIVMDNDVAPQTLDEWRSGQLVKVADKVGVPNIAVNIQKAIDANSNLIDDLVTVITITETKQKQDGVLSGKSFVLTGSFSRKKALIHADIENAGGEIHKSVSKNIDYLVQADKNSTSTKTQKAEKLGIEVIDEDDLAEIING